MEYKGIKLTLDMDISEFNSAIKRVKQTTNEFDDDIKKLKQNLKFDGSNVQQYTTLVDRLKSKYSETSKAIEFLKKVLDESLQTGKIQEYDKEWVFLTNQIITLEKNLEITDRNLKDVIGDWQKNGKIGKETLEGLNKPLEEQKTIWDRLNDRTDVFFGNLKANLVSNVISTGLNLLKSGIEAIWNGIKEIASAYTDLMKQGIEYNAQMQGYNTVLHAIGDDGEDGAEGIDNLIKSMKALGRQSAFSTSTLLDASQQLIASGIGADEVNKDITNLSKLLAYAGKGDDELKRMAQNLNQIQNAGKATAQDLKQFAYAGVPVYKLLANSSDEFKEITKDTVVQYADLVKAFELATQEGGKYFDAFDVYAQTYNGQVGMMKSNWQELLGVLAEDTTSTLTTIVMPTINQFMQDMLGAFETEGLDGVVRVFKEKLPEVIKEITDSGIVEQFLEGFTVIANTLSEALEDEETAKNIRNAIESILNTIADFIETCAPIIASFGVRIGEIMANAMNNVINQQMQEAWLSAREKYGDGGNIVIPSYVGGGSGGFGATQSGGFSNQITLNASFVANGNLDEAQALRFADLMTARINENLGQQI